MARKRALAGEMLQHDEPNWEPLTVVARDLVLSEFMWMHEIQLKNGGRLQAYKSIETRRYLHIDAEGQLYAYTEDGRYRPIDDDYAVTMALGCASWRRFDRFDDDS